MILRTTSLLAGFTLLELCGSFTAAANVSAINMQSSNLNTSPFRIYEDRPENCPPWYTPYLRTYTDSTVSTVCFRHLNVKIMPHATNSTANADVHQVSVETTVFNQVPFPAASSYLTPLVCDSLAD